MGVYDTYGKRELQIKAGECCLRCFKVGDVCDLEDGVYVEYDGFIVVKDKVFIAEFRIDQLFDKWGGIIKVDMDSRNPLVQAFKDK